MIWPYLAIFYKHLKNTKWACNGISSKVYWILKFYTYNTCVISFEWKPKKNFFKKPHHLAEKLFWNYCNHVADKLSLMSVDHSSFYGLMVSTQDFQSSDPSSNLGRSYIFFIFYFNAKLVPAKYWILKLYNTCVISFRSKLKKIGFIQTSSFAWKSV